ncbi:hypothetical protein M5J15_01300 [Serratia symbiotica]|uniref:hypothetical protein n=1 Tax=Serratia symbiotica TaxID=138074 RepID=UPI00209092FB|nr:hypothetical protein [Serratia symbiotica]USS95895.1 hypothetical protein M5J15_01300 [Serratia symbiotica]
MKITKQMLIGLVRWAGILVLLSTTASPALALSPIAAGQIRFTGAVVVPTCNTTLERATRKAVMECSNQWEGKTTAEYRRPEMAFHWIDRARKAAVLIQTYK